MALVMLPCDLPWWSNIHKKLTNLQECTEIDGMLDIMQKIHDLCKYRITKIVKLIVGIHFIQFSV